MIFPIVSSGAANQLAISDNFAKKRLEKYVDYYEDKSNSLNIEQIASEKYEPMFLNSNSGKLNFGFSRSAYWLRLKTINNSDHCILWYLEYGYPSVDYLTLYIPSEKGYCITETGDHHPFHKRALNYRTFVFPIHQPPGTHTYYLKIRSDGSLVMPLTGWAPKVFDKKKRMNWRCYGFAMV